MKLPVILLLGLCLNVANATPAAALPLLPKITATPAAVNFGPVGLGATAVPKVITVKNTGKSALLVSSINTSGLDVGDFNQTNNCGTIQPGGSCLVNVTFTPSLPYAEKTAILDIISNDTKKTPLQVKLSGKLPPPAIATTPAAVNFGKLPAETANFSKSVTIKNNGLSDLVIDSIAVTGSDSGDYTVSGSCGTIKKGEPCSISVLFEPRERNANRSASLIITSPQLTFSNGQYLAVWVDFDNNGKSAIHGTRIGTDGSLLNGPASMGGFAINGPDKMGFSPSVAPFGNYFLVAWQAEAFEPSRGIYAAWIDANGQLVALPGGAALSRLAAHRQHQQIILSTLILSQEAATPLLSG